MYKIRRNETLKITSSTFGGASPMPAQATRDWMKLFAPFNSDVDGHSEIALASNQLRAVS